MQILQRCKSILSLGALFFVVPVFANQAPLIDSLQDVSVSVGEQVSVRIVPRDADGVVPGLRVIDIPAGAMFSDNGDGTRTFKWLPQQNQLGTYKVTFEAIDAVDQNLRNGRSMVITVRESSSQNEPGIGNRPPEFESLVDRSVTVGDTFNFRVVPFDPEGLVPGLRLNNLPNGASFDDNRDGTRQFRWTPTAGQTGPHRLSFVAFEEADANINTTQTVTLTVNAGNADPVEDNEPNNGDSSLAFVDLNDQFVFLGQSLSLVVRATSADGSVPGLALDRMPVDSSFQDNGDGTRTFRWMPFPINLGDTFVDVIAIDSKDPTLRINKTIRIRVERDPNKPVNFSPVINGISNPVIRVGDTLNQVVFPKDPDFTVPNLQPLNLPSDAQFVDNGDGSRDVVWTTDANDLGDHTFFFRASDSEDANLFDEKSFTVSVVERATFDRPGERLRVLAEQRDFLLGFAIVLNSADIADNQLYLEMASEEFNMITPENSHKMGWIQPQRGVYRWEDADAIANYAMEKGMVLHGHPLIWYAQLPGWVQSADPSQARSIMSEYISALAGRYRGRVKVWDVVNEAINDEDGQLRESIWFRGMGEGYIREAFQMAKAADPNAILLYNDYDVSWINTKSDAMYNLLKRELEAGTPINGVGFQMHLRTDFTDFEGMKNNLQRFANLGLDIYITEFDVAQDAEGEEQKQAEIYRRALEICLAQSACKAMQSWGYTDRYSWRAGNRPLLLDSKYQVKPAYTAWQSTLRDYLR